MTYLQLSAGHVVGYGDTLLACDNSPAGGRAITRVTGIGQWAGINLAGQSVTAPGFKKHVFKKPGSEKPGTRESAVKELPPETEAPLYRALAANEQPIGYYPNNRNGACQINA